MDISKLVNSEDLFELNLTGPDTDELVGIRFMIRSAESDAVKRVVRQHSDKFLASRKKKLTASKVEAEYLDKAAASVASWDWGDHNWKGEKPECTFEKAREVLEEAGWIYDQVATASEDRANFTKSLAKGSAKPQRLSRATTASETRTVRPGASATTALRSKARKRRCRITVPSSGIGFGSSGRRSRLGSPGQYRSPTSKSPHGAS